MILILVPILLIFCPAVFCKGLGRSWGSGLGCWLLLGSAMGPGCACRREAGVGLGGRGANGRGGRGANFLADRPISPLIEVHLARPNTKITQNEPFIYSRPLCPPPPLLVYSTRNNGAFGATDQKPGFDYMVRECCWPAPGKTIAPP